MTLHNIVCVIHWQSKSILVSCLKCVPYFDALQVSVVFNLEAASCCGELALMERYKEVLVELGQVEQKMESQSMSSSSSSSECLGSAAVTGTGRASAFKRLYWQKNNF